jgi:hypothetical protein
MAAALQPCVTEGVVPITGRDGTQSPTHEEPGMKPMVLLIPLAVIAIVASIYLLIGALQN